MDKNGILKCGVVQMLSIKVPLQYSCQFCFELSLLVTRYTIVTNITCITIFATTHKLAKLRLEVLMRMSK